MKIPKKLGLLCRLSELGPLILDLMLMGKQHLFPEETDPSALLHMCSSFDSKQEVLQESVSVRARVCACEAACAP